MFIRIRVYNFFFSGNIVVDNFRQGYDFSIANFRCKIEVKLVVCIHYKIMTWR